MSLVDITQLKNSLLAKLKEINIDVPPNLSDEDFFVSLFDFIFKIIPVKRREVIKSQTLLQNPKYQQYEQLILDLEQKIANGKNINPHQSKQIKNFRKEREYESGMTSIKNDYLLTDWKVWHLHFGELKSNKCFSERDGDILFVYIDDTKSKMYFLDIFDHDDFQKKEIIEIIHAEYPDLIVDHKINGCEGLDRDVTDGDREILREHSINTPIELNDRTVYMGPGGGFSAAGSNINSIRLYDRLSEFDSSQLKDVETQLLSLIGELDFLK